MPWASAHARPFSGFASRKSIIACWSHVDWLLVPPYKPGVVPVTDFTCPAGALLDDEGELDDDSDDGPSATLRVNGLMPSDLLASRNTSLGAPLALLAAVCAVGFFLSDPPASTTTAMTSRTTAPIAANGTHGGRGRAEVGAGAGTVVSTGAGGIGAGVGGGPAG